MKLHPRGEIPGYAYAGERQTLLGVIRSELGGGN